MAVTQKCRVALVGFGAIAEQAHLPALQSPNSQAEVVAVVDTLQERRESAQELVDAKVFAGVNQMLESGVELDIVVVTLPPAFTPPVVGQLADAGHYVLAEKPFAVSSGISAEVSANVRHQRAVRVVHNYLYRSDVELAVSLIRAGRIGEVRLIRLERPDAGHYVGKGGDPDWRRRRTEVGGGCLTDNGYHWVYVAEALANTPVISGVAVVGSNVTGAAEDVALATLRHRGGALTTILTSWCGIRGQEVLEVYGTEGSVRLLGETRGVELTTATNHQKIPPVHCRDSFQQMYNGLGQEVPLGRLPGVHLGENVRILTILSQLYTAGTVLDDFRT